MRSPSAGSPPSVPGTRHKVPNAVFAPSMLRNVLSPRAPGGDGRRDSERERKGDHPLRELERAKAELARRERERPRALSAEDRRRLLALGADLQSVWEAPTTTARDRKELLRTLLEEVIIIVFKAQPRARLTLRWRGGSLT